MGGKEIKIQKTGRERSVTNEALENWVENNRVRKKNVRIICVRERENYFERDRKIR